jgi:hypothetical protein
MAMVAGLLLAMGRMGASTACTATRTALLHPNQILAVVYHLRMVLRRRTRLTTLDGGDNLSIAYLLYVRTISSRMSFVPFLKSHFLSLISIPYVFSYLLHLFHF